MEWLRSNKRDRGQCRSGPGGLSNGRLVGCQVAIARHGHIAYAKSFGLMDREGARPVREDTLWRIYSMTKPITSVALMMLYERGRFQLDEPVARYAPSWTGHRVWVSGAGDELVLEPVRLRIAPPSYRAADQARGPGIVRALGRESVIVQVPDKELRIVLLSCPASVKRAGSELFMDHPPLEKRLAALAEIAREMGRPVSV